MRGYGSIAVYSFIYVVVVVAVVVAGLRMFIYSRNVLVYLRWICASVLREHSSIPLTTARVKSEQANNFESTYEWNK